MKAANRLNSLSIVGRVILLSCACFLPSCQHSSNRTAEEIIQADYEQLYADVDVAEIDLEQAITLALKHNLDAQIAEQDYAVSLSDAKLQKMNALPSIIAKREFITRSNSGAASSFSVITGARSLEPSISTEQSRWVSLLEMNWDLLDSAINIYRSKSAVDRAVVAQERYRKVQQNIIMDSYSVFWKLAALQKIEASLQAALDASNEKLEVLNYAESNGDISFDTIRTTRRQIIEKRLRLLDVQKEAQLAELQFKALLSLPPEKDIKLVYDNAAFEQVPDELEGKNFDAMVRSALYQRPEIREELLNLKISERNVNLEILQTFPGLNIILAANEDENIFLEDSTWISLTAGITQSITKLLTLPARLEKAESELEFANAKRRALLAAVISQVYISKVVYNQAQQSYAEEKRAFGLSEKYMDRHALLKESGLVSGLEEANNRLEHEVEQVQYYTRLVELHAAHARLMNSLGYDLINLPQFASRKRVLAMGGTHE